MRLADFIIGGAPRSGTSWLWHLADRHPGLAMAKPLRPEPKFFLIDELYNKGADYYSATWFADLPETVLVGEKSTNYLEGVGVAARIKETIPDVRLIFLLRNPVERAYSNYGWSRKNGMENEGFMQALLLEEQREAELPAALRYARPHAYFSRGLYADLLAPFFALFPREQILIVRTEEIAQHPTLVAEKLHRFLGIEVRAQDALGLAPINQLPPGEPLPEDARSWMLERYAEPNRRLAALLGGDFVPWFI
ncbi:sulfotransferase family protein [Candidatus Magnetaquicoccus inordinatus]|uniref:sulfotransferase family protein n=1 Tax=Candidatus Magnetaquicoccus inordinatus TaxID=2496818 RepID=UPI00102D0031|nr:sulfotransferase [Candidatus Magnetaquicoccus inordinatus]